MNEFLEIREYCLSLNNGIEEFPFYETTPVYKVCGKIFAILSVDEPVSINLKANPEHIIDRIERYSSVKPGFHMNKVHWHTIELQGDVSIKLLKSWIDESYSLIVQKLPKKLKNGL